MIMQYVADTHALVWYLIEDEKLGRRAFRALNDAERKHDTLIIIPSIVLVEALGIAEKKKIYLKFDELTQKINAGENYIVSALDMGVVERLPLLSAIKEMHDRIIVATAQIFDAPIITKDSEIVASKLAKTIW